MVTVMRPRVSPPHHDQGGQSYAWAMVLLRKRRLAMVADPMPVLHRPQPTWQLALSLIHAGCRLVLQRFLGCWRALDAAPMGFIMQP